MAEGFLAQLLPVARHQLSEKDWRAVGALAGLRRATNDPIRAPDRDRGDRKNIINDVAGALAEIVALRACEALPDVVVTHSLLSLDGPVEHDTDLLLRRRRELRLETKGHFIDPAKKLFAVNARAHARARARGAEGYVLVVSAMGAGLAVSSRIVTTAMLDQVAPRRLGPHQDPALAIPLDEVARGHFDADWPMLRREVLATVAACRERLVEDAEAVGAAALKRARRERLVLPHDSAGAVEALAQLVST